MQARARVAAGPLTWPKVLNRYGDFLSRPGSVLAVTLGTGRGKGSVMNV